MRSYVWPNEDGWPYPDAGRELVSVEGEVDDDALALALSTPHLLDGLGPLERQVVEARYGVGGVPVRTMKQLQAELGVPRHQLRSALGDGLAKLRARFR